MKTKLPIIYSVLLLVLVAACSFLTPPPTTTPIIESTPAPSATESPHYTAAPVITETSAIEVTDTPSPSPTDYLTPTPTPGMEIKLSKKGPGRIKCPIFLYHRISIPENYNPNNINWRINPYYVLPDEFRKQIQMLNNWGYTTIPIKKLTNAISLGETLPDRPIIITFDDGDESVYTQAFPIMKEFGFTGVIYLVYNYIGTPGYMTVDQIKELAAAGWEVGSHSMTHSDLTTASSLNYEVMISRRKLEILLHVPVRSFAYPFGKDDINLRNFVARYYTSAMGLGVYVTQRPGDQYYLWRKPIENGWDENYFASFLPWSSKP